MFMWMSAKITYALIHRYSPYYTGAGHATASRVKKVIHNLLLFRVYCVLGSVIGYMYPHFFRTILGFITSSCSPSEEAPQSAQIRMCSKTHCLLHKFKSKLLSDENVEMSIVRLQPYRSCFLQLSVGRHISCTFPSVLM